MYRVEVPVWENKWTLHSVHESYEDAVWQSDTVHGRIVCGTGLTDEEAWRYASIHQGYDGTYDDWTRQENEEREQYEHGANPCT